MSPARFLLDTNICIHIRRRRPPEVLDKFRNLKAGEAVISVITYGELIYGAEKSQQRENALAQLAELIGLIPVVALPQETGAAYGRVRVQLEKRGETIGNNDLWIAAHALAANLRLVTSNGREFRRVIGLHVEDWTS
jgi:tRNA(fMet)-specific endonuclease VapC